MDRLAMLQWIVIRTPVYIYATLNELEVIVVTNT